MRERHSARAQHQGGCLIGVASTLPQRRPKRVAAIRRFVELEIQVVSSPYCRGWPLGASFCRDFGKDWPSWQGPRKARPAVGSGLRREMIQGRGQTVEGSIFPDQFPPLLQPPASKRRGFSYWAAPAVSQI